MPKPAGGAFGLASDLPVVTVRSGLADQATIDGARRQPKLT